MSADAVIATPRLHLRRLTLDDASFIVDLLNDPDFLRYIGDRGVRTIGQAHDYLRTGPLASYERLGYGLYCVETRARGTPIGICGLLKRDVLEVPDLGFAYLPAARGRGHAVEAGAAMLEHGARVHGFRRIVAVTAPDNQRSGRVLERLGMRYEGGVRLVPEEQELRLYGWRPD